MAGEPAVQHWAKVPPTRSGRPRGLRLAPEFEASATRTPTVNDSPSQCGGYGAWGTRKLDGTALISCMSQETPNPVAGSDPAQRLVTWQQRQQSVVAAFNGPVLLWQNGRFTPRLAAA